MNQWNADRYDAHARFVSDLGAPLLELLGPRQGQAVLDLGCGDGALTAKLPGTVFGIDQSLPMVEAALARGVNASVADMHDFELNRRFDAVFTNAVLHWTRDIDAVLRSVARHLNPGGHFVGEFGGFGNVAAIETAWHAASGLSAHPYYPTPNEFSARLAAAGFGCDLAQLIPRPTPLPTGMRAWLQTFRAYTIAHLPPAQQEEIIARAEALLQPRLCDSQGNWTADYVRLRFHATLLTAAPQPA